jgi:hypothetical protein
MRQSFGLVEMHIEFGVEVHVWKVEGWVSTYLHWCLGLDDLSGLSLRFGESSARDY